MLALNLTHPVKEKIKIEKDMLDINLLIYETTDVIKLVFNKKDISLINEISNEEEVYIMGDYNRLKQVFVNVIKNSIEAINDNNGIIEINEKEIKLQDNSKIYEIEIEM